MKRYVHALLLLVLAALLPGLAAAADAYVVDSVSLRAGPDIGYPSLLILPAGIPVAVYGCTSGWEWCDVQAGPNRGWVSGDYLQYEYQNQRVFVPSYGARIGIPIVAFSLGLYWDQHYRNRSFYRDRNSWSHRKFSHRPPPRPPVRPPSQHQPRPPHRPPVNQPRPPAHTRPPNHGRPPSGQRPPGHTGPVTRPAQGAAPRPTPNARPVQNARPAPNARPAQNARPAPNARPAQNARPAPNARPAQKAPPAPKKDHDKSDHRER